jgi:DNA-binding winged helix-turn-helix (wHTH) protein
MYPTGPLAGSLAILNGPSGLDDPDPDILVMPAEDFLALPSHAIGPRRGILYIAYGPVRLMEKAFDGGCIDYIREPWALPELRARVGRFYRQRFRAGARTLELRGRSLGGSGSTVELSERECALLGLLIMNAPRPIPREAAAASISSSPDMRSHGLGHCIASIRRKLDCVEPGLGSRLHAIRGFGYRMDVGACG